MDSNSCNWPPASGRDLEKAIDQAIATVDRLETRNGSKSKRWHEFANVWRALLQQSRPENGQGIVNVILKGDLAAPLRIQLDGRYWNRFSRWYYREVFPELKEEAKKSGVPTLTPVRWSDPKGGYFDRKESILYLVFEGSCTETLGADTEETCPAPKVSEDSQQRKDNTRRQSSLSRATSWIGDAARMDRQPFGISMVLLGLVLLGLCNFLPEDSRRVVFLGMAITVSVVGFWFMEQADCHRPTVSGGPTDR